MSKRASKPAFFVFFRGIAYACQNDDPADERHSYHYLKMDAFGVDIQKIEALVEPALSDMGYELVAVQYLSEHGRWILRILADKPGGITLDDCALLSRRIGPLLDIKDIISHEYVLEVSSPGLDRPLVKEEDFLQAIGKKIKVRMVVPVNGRRRFTGYLREFQGRTLYVAVDDQMVTLPRKGVEKANIVYEYGK